MKRLFVLCSDRKIAAKAMEAMGADPAHHLLVYVGPEDAYRVTLLKPQMACWVDLGGNGIIRISLRLKLGPPLDPSAACWALSKITGQKRNDTPEARSLLPA